eukprot:CAMPEP_0173306040 /NCGR_PEP_ID=MMETSP1143-20121109/20347_1 /TAXON_ID=483371 /ORGANISM="non described non described, Strain CCMP2298" /LENGTH=145 /DNA_ID=CAMNT_0014247063 /DNA_START=21 /DNA_END=455 /DNA_ORIENTATION=-
MTLAHLLVHLSCAYSCAQGSGGISHQTARAMLGRGARKDLGSMEFMGAEIGSGVFVATAGLNRVMLHQAANDGFRGVYMLCFSGPDRGKGFVLCSNGDNPAVVFQAEVCREVLGVNGLGFTGIDYSQWSEADLLFDIRGLKQEAI